MTNFKEELERWATMLPDPAKQHASQMIAGARAWPKIKERLTTPVDVPPWVGPLDMFGIPVHVRTDWPSNLVAITDQEGNAMSAWIIND